MVRVVSFFPSLTSPVPTNGRFQFAPRGPERHGSPFPPPTPNRIPFTIRKRHFIREPQATAILVIPIFSFAVLGTFPPLSPPTAPAC